MPPDRSGEVVRGLAWESMGECEPGIKHEWDIIAFGGPAAALECMRCGLVYETGPAPTNWPPRDASGAGGEG